VLEDTGGIASAVKAGAKSERAAKQISRRELSRVAEISFVTVTIGNRLCTEGSRPIVGTILRRISATLQHVQAEGRGVRALRVWAYASVYDDTSFVRRVTNREPGTRVSELSANE